MSERSARRANERQIEKRQRRARARAARAAAVGGLLTGVALLAAPGAEAASLQVNTGGDAGSGDCSDGACTLREAVAAAVAAPGADTITFASTVTGEITLTQGALAVDGGGPLTITGPGASTLAISGDADNDNVRDVATSLADQGDSRIFDLVVPYDDPTGDVSISGLTLREGVASGYESYTYYGHTYTEPQRENGGAVVAENTKLTITDSVIEDNLSTRDGGGVWADSLQMSGTTVTGNTAMDDGGGVSVYGYSYYSDPAPSRIEDSTFSDNLAGGTAIGEFDPYYSTSAGGLNVYGGSGLVLADLEITDNTSKGPSYTYYGHTYNSGNGGGLVADTYGSASIRDLTITGNEAGESGGGAVIGGGSVTGLEVTGNTAGSDGGGLEVDYGTVYDSTIAGNDAFSGGGVSLGGSGKLERSTVSGNTAVWAGGVRMFGGRLVDSTVSGNAANAGSFTGVAGNAGGVLAYGSYYGFSVIRSSTIAGNTASQRGGGLYVYAYSAPSDPAEASTVIQSTIVGDNSAPSSPDVSGGVDYGNASNLARTSFSLLESSSSVISGDPALSNKIGVDPKLGALANNGGPTQTMLPLGSSPAIDAGVAGSLTKDQRGGARIADTSVANAPLSDGADIGAVEIAGNVDRTAPVATITSGPGSSKTVSQGPWTFTFSSNEPGSTFRCSLDGESPGSSCTSSKTYNDLAAGPHVFAVEATDAAGNVSSRVSYPFTVKADPVLVDKTPPDVAFHSTPPATIKLAKGKTTTPVSFAFHGSDNVDGPFNLIFECKLDSAAFEECRPPWTGNVKKGSHTFLVRATDLSGNTDPTPASYDFVVKKAKKKHGGKGGKKA